MRTLLTEYTTLRDAMITSGANPDRFVADAATRLAMDDLAAGSALFDRGNELSDRTVLVAMNDQLTTAAILLELDGIARRIVLCSPDMPIEHFPYIIEAAGVDTIVSDRSGYQIGKPRPMCFSPYSRTIAPSNHHETPATRQTEWVLLTSGTTGLPKLVVHTLESLAGAIERKPKTDEPVIWSTFYDIRRYGGLQIFLRAVLTGASLVLSSNQEGIADFVARAASMGVTHISGTPSQWRRALMSASAPSMAPGNIRLSGEVADQSLLNKLRSTFPQARIVHAFASTEAGVAFEVKDGLAGFPASTLTDTARVDMKIDGGTLRVRSARTADRYLGEQAPRLKDADGFVDTGDIIEVRDGRCFFAGRRDGVINVGGLKVYPEEIEAVINRHPEVQMTVVRAKKSPVTGSVVIADIVLKAESSSAGYETKAIQDDILLLCKESLSAYKIPAAINIVESVAVAGSGKVIRRECVT